MSEPADPTLGKLTLPSQGPGRVAVLLALASGLLMALVLVAVAVFSWYGEIQRQVEATHPAALRWSADSVRMELGRARASVDWLAGGVALEDPALAETLGQLLTKTPVFDGAIVVDDRGRLLASVGTATALDPIVRLLSTERAVDAGLSQAMAAAELRRKLASAEPGGVHVLEVDPDVVLLASAVTPGGGFVHGLVCPEVLAQALRVDLIGSGGIQLADAQGRVFAGAGRSAGNPISPDALHAPEKPKLSAPWSDEGIWTVRSALPVGVLDLTLVAHQPLYLTFEPLFVAAVQMALAGALALGLCVLLASLAAKRQTHKLQLLLDGLRAVSSSALDTRLPDRETGGQIGLLYRSFNAMAARIEADLRSRDARIEATSRQNVGFQKQHELLAKLSITDGLTQLYNHRYFQDQLSREIKRLSRTGEGLSILIIDIDNFKQLNDTYGHAAGDEFLKQLAGILKESVRETDLLARYGGEEFVIVAVGTTAPGAELLAEKLRTQVAETSFIVDETKRPRSVTVSIGVAQFRHSKTELFAAADAALYRAKAAGKNCVMVADAADRGDSEK